MHVGNQTLACMNGPPYALEAAKVSSMRCCDGVLEAERIAHVPSAHCLMVLQLVLGERCQLVDKGRDFHVRCACRERVGPDQDARVILQVWALDDHQVDLSGP